jgi:hypothetical protein
MSSTAPRRQMKLGAFVQGDRTKAGAEICSGDGGIPSFNVRSELAMRVPRPPGHLLAFKFSYADAGQMHLYLNYAREHWMKPGEPPRVVDPLRGKRCIRGPLCIGRFAQ